MKKFFTICMAVIAVGLLCSAFTQNVSNLSKVASTVPPDPDFITVSSTSF